VKDLHPKLDPIFRKELETYGHIYMFNYMPREHPAALPFDMIPGKTVDARAMTLMILNNLDPKVA
jgi:urocanate hydratase